jgi:hypothetical protein
MAADALSRRRLPIRGRDKTMEVRVAERASQMAAVTVLKRSCRCVPSAADRPQVQLVAPPEPDRAIPVVAQFIVGIRMREHVKLAVIEGEPTQYVGELRMSAKRNLETPLRMGPTGRS